ncbi:hypothetical protein [Wenyingzhuangia sp. IMCC45467]
MIKNSTVVLSASIIMMGIIVNGIINNIYERKNVIDDKRYEVHQQILKVKPQLMKTEDLDVFYIPQVNFKNDVVNVRYQFYKLENNVLQKIPIH